jgi:hypothetical protein
MEEDVFSIQPKPMSDHFQNHVARIKSEKGEKWSQVFDHDFAHFKLCSLLARARKITKLSRSAVSSMSGISERIIVKIEREDADVAVEHLDALSKFYMQKIMELKPADRAATTNRLGALVASMSHSEGEFADCA